jgi:hypothetical protein
MKKAISRREAITECVNTFIKNYPQEYKDILDSIKIKQGRMPMNSWGEVVKEDGKLSEENFRLSLRLPARLLTIIDQLLSFHQQEGLFSLKNEQDASKELQWFKETFPQFVVPKEKKRTF